jgi:hypothetical protein
MPCIPPRCMIDKFYDGIGIASNGVVSQNLCLSPAVVSERQRLLSRRSRFCGDSSHGWLEPMGCHNVRNGACGMSATEHLHPTSLWTPQLLI